MKKLALAICALAFVFTAVPSFAEDNGAAASATVTTNTQKSVKKTCTGDNCPQVKQENANMERDAEQTINDEE